MAASKYLTVERLDSKTIRRLFSKISVHPTNGCWDWIGTNDPHGYGSVSFRGKTERVHRVLFAWLVHALPVRCLIGSHRLVDELDHVACSRPVCCNPAHMAFVSHRDNILRSDTALAADNSRKVLCKRGHDLIDRGYQRVCPICRSMTNRARRFGAGRERILAKERDCAKRRWHGPDHDALLDAQRRRQKQGQIQ